MENRKVRKRGQVTFFVIIALIIVAVVLVIFLFPRLNVFVEELNPSSFLRTCIENDVKSSVNILSKQGGYFLPNNYYTYKGKRIQYLCYTDELYKPCIVQQPLLVSHVEEEIENQVKSKADQCVEELVKQYERRGFDVERRPSEINVDIIQGKIVVDFISPMTIRKESTQTFEKFAVGLDTELYELLMTAVSIIQYESTFGDSETTLYLQYYPNLRIDKIRRNDGNTIYKLSNVATKDEFTFASRSLVWPEGYGFDELGVSK
mgnify:FL=1